MKFQLVWVLVLVPALVAALLGWRTARGRRYSLYDEAPVGMSQKAYSQRERRRYFGRRLSKALLYAVIGAALGFGVSLYLQLHV